MSNPGEDVQFSDLPQVIPVFPLPGALLLPGGHMPLHIFEPRYRAMIQDVLAGPRIIGMMQPRNPNQKTKVQDLYGIGCAGRVQAFRETDDGRFYITLKGICRFAVVEELEAGTPYRQAVVTYARYRADMLPGDDVPVDREKLMPALREFLTRFEVKIDWEALEKVPDDALVRSLAMMCPFEPNEKQALLEAETPTDRGTLVTALIEMAIVPEASDETRLQ
jgi:hypothetical protein